MSSYRSVSVRMNSLLPKHTPTLPILRLALHLLADLNVHLEELGHAAVQAHGLALVEIRLTVRRIDALCRA